MKKVKTTNARLKIYEDISELPITKFNQLNEYQIMNSGIGCTKEDVTNHLDRIAMFAINGKKEETIAQRKNMHQCIWNVLRGYNFEFLQLISLSNEKGSENEHYKLIGYNLESMTNEATNEMPKINALTKQLDNSIRSWMVNDMIVATTALKRVLPAYIEKHSKSFDFKDSDLLEGLKKKFNSN